MQDRKVPAPGADLSLSRVLIVDDEQPFLDLISEALAKAGLDVRACSRPEGAAELAREFMPDILLIDLVMPEVGGIELCRSLRSSEEARDAIVILITGKVDAADRSQAIVEGLDCGADDYLVKPFGIQEMVARVQAWARVKAARDEAARLRDQIHLAERQLKESESRFATAFRVSPNLMSITRLADGRIVDISDSFLAALEYEREEVLGRSTLELAMWADSSERDMLAADLKETNISLDREVGIRTKSGKIRTVMLSTTEVELDGEPHLISVASDVTDRKLVERMIETQRDRSQHYLDIVATMLVALDAEGRVTMINRKGLDILGYGEAEVVGQEWFKKFLPERLRDQVREVFGQMIAGEVQPVENFENPVLTADGQERLIAWHNSLLRDEDGRISGTLSSGEDVTESRQAEEQVRSLMENATSVVLLLSPTHEILEFNPEAGRLYGRKREEVLGKNYLELFLPAEARESVAEDMRKVLDGTPTKGFENAIISASGETRILNWNVGRVVGPTGQPTGVVAIGVDVTDHRQAEEALHESQGRYRRLIESSHEVIFSKDLEGRYFALNLNAAIGLGGTCVEDIEGKTDYDLMPRKQADALRAADKEVIEAGRHMDIEESVRDAQGNTKVYLSHKWPISDRDGKVSGVGCLAMDITERKHAEEALRKSEQRNRLLLENLPAVVWATNREGKTNYLSPNVTTIYGYTPEETYAGGPDAWFGNIHPDDLELVRRGYERLFTEGKPYDAEYRLRRKDGEWIWIHDQAAAVQEADGAQLAYGVFHEITERKQIEELLEAQRTLALGLTRAAGLEEGLRLCTETALSASGMDCGGVYLVDESSGALELTYTRGMRSDFAQHVSHFDADSPSTQLVMAGKPVFTRHQDMGVALDERRQVEGLRAIGILPVFHDDRVIGCLNVSSHAKDEVPQRSRVALETIAAQIGGALVRLKAEEDMRVNAERLAKFMDSASDSFYLLDKDLRFVDMNRKGLELVGMCKDEVVGKHITELVPDVESSGRLAMHQQVLETGESFTLDNFVSHPKFGQMHFILKSFRVGDGLGVIASDITERKRAEEAVREGEERYRTLFESASDAILVLEDGKFVGCNQAALTFFGRAREQIIGHGPEEFSPESQRDGTRSVDAAGVKLAAALGGQPQHFEWTHQRLDGSRFDAEVTLNSISLSGRRQFIAISRDITERKRAQEALRESEERYRGLFEQSSDAIFIHNREGEMLDANAEACRMLNCSREELLARKLGESQPEEDRAAAREAYATFLQTGHVRFETRLRASDGRVVDVEIDTTMVDTEKGTCQGIVRDITGRKHAEAEQREHAAHLEAEARRARQYAEVVGRGDPNRAMIGEGPAYQRVLEFVHNAGRAPSAVLVLGESGTGKEVTSRSIHAAGLRADQPFVVVDCAALKGELLESELFGHERGAFTGATQAKAGLVEVADGGTLFVDEIGEMPLPLQSKLLRVLERGEYRRLGSTREMKADIRVIAATNRDLAREVEEGLFRRDLFYRLNVLSITLPPLRERREDVPLLAMHFLKNSRVTMPDEKKLERKALRKLQAYSWPGNIRELANVLERAAILSGSREEIRSEHLPSEIRKAGDSSIITSKVVSLADAEREAVKAALAASEWNKTKAAKVLGISRLTLRKKVDKYGLAP